MIILTYLRINFNKINQLKIYSVYSSNLLTLDE